MKDDFQWTDKQLALFETIGKFKHVMAYGGSRSAKTFGMCGAIVTRAAHYKSRHLVARLKFNHAKTSLFYDTFPKVFNLAFPGMSVDDNRSDWFFRLPNGSEIWVGGLDEKQRVEKILGREYSTVFFNEVSQIPYSSVTMALTRLAEKNDLRKIALYDENPPKKRHWSYPLFMKGLDPDTWEPRRDAKNYGYIHMNPQDNLENIDEDYLSMLESLPEKDRQRFLHGEFQDDSGGQIYHAFDREKHVKSLERLQVPLTIGMDFNVNPGTAVICQLIDNTVHVIDEIWIENSNTKMMAEEILRRYPGRWRLIPDSTGSKRSTSAPMAAQSDISILKNYFTVPHVRNPFRVDRYNNVNNLFEKGRLFVDKKCVKLIRDLEQVAYKESTNQPDTQDKSLTHISDALGYLVSWAHPIVQVETSVGSLPR